MITNGLSATDTVGREIIGCLALMDELCRLLCAPSEPVPVTAGAGLQEPLSSECAVEGQPGVGHSGIWGYK